MSKAMTVRVDETTKIQAEAILEEIGLNMTTYVHSSLKALVREGKVQFELSTKERANSEYLAKLDMSIAQAGRGEVVKYSMDDLNALVNEE